MEVSESWIRKQATKLQLSIKETAEFIGKGQQYVRMGLQTRRHKFGSAVQTREPTRTNPVELGIMTYSEYRLKDMSA